MRNRILTSLCSLLALGPVGAHAAGNAAPQRPAANAGSDDDTQQGDDQQQDQGANETEGTEVTDQEQQTPVKPGQGGKTVAPGEVHTVVKGDTLWDLSQRYLGNPWYWPKVWSYNPEIANPHWIYPGNSVRFFPAGEEVPSQVETGTGPVAEENEGVEASEMMQEGGPASEVQVAAKIGYEMKPGQRLKHEGFVTPREVEEAGKIVGSFSESLMLSAPETVYLQFKRRPEIRVGDRYVVFHTEAEVKHPSNGARFGYLTKILGTVRVVSLSEKKVTAQIVDSWDEIERGDLVGPYGERLVDVISPRPNDRNLKGYVVGSLVAGHTLDAEQSIIVVDKGSADGVQQGNTFVIVRSGDQGGDFINPAKGQDRSFPTEDVAACMAVDVKERASTCLLTRSIREVVYGDRVEMRAGTGGSQPVSRR